MPSHKQQRSARSARAEPSERDALSRRIRYDARRTSKEREAGDGPQPVIDVDAGLLLHLGLIHDRDEGGRLGLTCSTTVIVVRTGSSLAGSVGSALLRVGGRCQE